MRSARFVGAIAIVDSIQFIPEDPSAKQIRQTVDGGQEHLGHHRLSRNLKSCQQT